MSNLLEARTRYENSDVSFWNSTQELKGFAGKMTVVNARGDRWQSQLQTQKGAVHYAAPSEVNQRTQQRNAMFFYLILSKVGKPSLLPMPGSASQPSRLSVSDSWRSGIEHNCHIPYIPVRNHKIYIFLAVRNSNCHLAVTG